MIVKNNHRSEKGNMAEDRKGPDTQSALDEQVESFAATFSDFRRLMGVGFKHAHQQGFSVTQFMVLHFVEKAEADEPCTISSIANHLGTDPATVVRTVDSLEKRGLVARRRDKHDRRQVFVEFTQAGRIARLEMQERFEGRIKAIFSAMSEQGRVSLLAGLEEFVYVGQQVEQETPSCIREFHHSVGIGLAPSLDKLRPSV